MTIKNIFLFSLIYAISLPTWACINTYAFELGRAGLSKTQAQQKIQKTKIKQLQGYQQHNDYGVLLIYAERYQDAIEVFEKIEKQHPNLGKTAANLGTAYELAGQFEQAQYWIEQGIKRDPNIHEGSEWIHVKILQAQMEKKKNAKWLQTHDVLGLNFGSEKYPIPYVRNLNYQNKNYNLDTVLKHSKIQMNQRLQFVRQDPIVGQILFNMANIEVLQLNWGDDTARLLYALAEGSGYENKELLRKREAYIKNASRFTWFGNVIKAYFLALIA